MRKKDKAVAANRFSYACSEPDTMLSGVYTITQISSPPLYAKNEVLGRQGLAVFCLSTTKVQLIQKESFF